MIFIGDGVVQLDDAVEAMPGQIAGCLIVFRVGRAGECGGWPQSLECTVSIEQVRSYRAMGYAVEAEDRVSSGLICSRWFRCVIQRAYQKVLSLTDAKDEKL